MYKYQCLWKSSSSSDSSCEIHKICKFSSFIYMIDLLDSSHGHFLKRAPYCHSNDELVMLQNSEFISIYTDLTIILSHSSQMITVIWEIIKNWRPRCWTYTLRGTWPPVTMAATRTIWQLGSIWWTWCSSALTQMVMKELTAVSSHR